MGFFVALSQEKRRRRSIFPKSTTCCHANAFLSTILVLKATHPPIFSVWVQRHRPASPRRPHSHYLCIAPIFHPLRSKQPQTVQLTINTHALQNLCVSQEPNCLLLDRRQWLRTHLYARMRSQPPNARLCLVTYGGDDLLCDSVPKASGSSDQTTRLIENFFFNERTHMVYCPHKGRIYWTSGNTISLEQWKEHVKADFFLTGSAIWV